MTVIDSGAVTVAASRARPYEASEVKDGGTSAGEVRIWRETFGETTQKVTVRTDAGARVSVALTKK